jgi:hypothetical protein
LLLVLLLDGRRKGHFLVKLVIIMLLLRLRLLLRLLYW